VSADRRYRLIVDGRERLVEAPGEMPLLWALRDRLGLTSARYGCGLGVCGACTVLEGSAARRACQISLADAEGRSFTTLEGLSADGSHPVQRAWIEEDVAQCGYCQTGMILETVALLARHHDPDDAQIDEALHDVLCRCGTYTRVRRAVKRAAQLARAGGG
jgi:isoquinoline 1-oxidoreductase alpha subunit